MNAIDLFAGAGGWSEGAKQAGVRVDVAANHWPLAVESHRLNHPDTEHRCQDVGLMDPRDLPPHQIVLASPACQGHSPARGKEQPHHDAMRSTAWCVVNVVEVTRPQLLAVENVPEFRDWALFDLWRAALVRLGYHLTEQVLDASAFGVPQERARLFVLGSLKRKLPELDASHAPVPASSFIDWSAGRWSAVPDHVPATVARVARARRDGFGRRFVMPYYGNGSGLTGRSLARPIGTITTRARWAVVDGDRMRMLTVAENKAAMGFSPAYRLAGNQAEQIHQLGNAVCPPVARAVVEHLLRAA